MNEWMERIERLEQASQAAEQARQAAERHARLWQLAAGVLAAVGLVLLPLRSGMAQRVEPPAVGPPVGGLPAVQKRLAALETSVGQLQGRFDPVATVLERFAVENGGDDIVITGANLHIRNGLGATATLNGRGNLIVGYGAGNNEPPLSTNARNGSHNIVVGSNHSWLSFGGLVAGQQNQIADPYASVSGGTRNLASGEYASVSGGEGNIASERASSVSGGLGNTASGEGASVSGGGNNRAGHYSASVSGGAGVVQSNLYGWAGGSLGGDLVSGRFRSP